MVCFSFECQPSTWGHPPTSTLAIATVEGWNFVRISLCSASFGCRIAFQPMKWGNWSFRHEAATLELLQLLSPLDLLNCHSSHACGCSLWILPAPRSNSNRRIKKLYSLTTLFLVTFLDPSGFSTPLGHGPTHFAAEFAIAYLHIHANTGRFNAVQGTLHHQKY